jgi:1-acyl-sn-glycerol-3-phosphate acyltransferase
MKYLGIAFRQIWGAWFYLNLAAWFFILLPVFAITLSFERLYPIAHHTRRFWGTVLQVLSLQFWTIKYKAKIDFKKHYIICSNHTSYLDIPMVCHAVPAYFSFMAKEELAKLPLFGRFFRTIDISVNRKSVRDSFRAFEVAREHVAKGASIVIFPEGTIPLTAPVMKKFKPGAFRIAAELGVPVLPITFLDNWRLLPDDGKFRALPGIVRAVVHAPIETKGLDESSLAAFSELVYKTINQPLIDDGIVNGSPLAPPLKSYDAGARH